MGKAPVFDSPPQARLSEVPQGSGVRLIHYLIDTNAVAEVRKNKPHGAALAWMQDLELEQVLFSAVTSGEIQRGIELTRKQHPVKANESEVWVAQLERSSKVLPMDSACFKEYARLMHKRSETLAEDAMIAATARVHGLTVATRNERDFRHLSVAVFNPFKVGKPRTKE